MSNNQQPPKTLARCRFPPKWGYTLLGNLGGQMQEGRLQFFPDRVEYVEMDTSHITLHRVSIPAKSFPPKLNNGGEQSETYHCETPCVAGLDLISLAKIINELGKLNEPPYLEVELRDVGKNCEFFHIKAGQMELDLYAQDVDAEIPNYDSIVKMKAEEGITALTINSARLAEIVAIADIMAEVITFEVTPEKTLVLSTASPMGELRTPFDPHCIYNDATWGEPCRNYYAISMLKAALKFAPLNSEGLVSLAFKRSSMIFIEYTFAPNREAIFTGVIAPRVEEEDD